MQIPIENKGKGPMFVGGVMIPAGETRHFDEQDVPPEYRQAPAPAVADEPQDPLTALLAGNVATVVNGFALLADGELVALGEMEQQAAKPRKSLLEAVEVELLRRAAVKVEGSAGEPDALGEGAGAA